MRSEPAPGAPDCGQGVWASCRAQGEPWQVLRWLVTGSDVHRGPRRSSSGVDDGLQEDTGAREAHRGAAAVARGSDARASD